MHAGDSASTETTNDALAKTGGNAVSQERSAETMYRQRLIEGHLKTLVETYRHHFDLFVKGWFLYFAVVGAIASYLSRSGVSPALQSGAAIVIAVLSLVGVQRCQPLWHWVVGMERSISELAGELGVPTISLSGAKSVIRTVQIGCAGILVTALAFVWLAARVGG